MLPWVVTSCSVSPGSSTHEGVLPVGRKIPVPPAHLTPDWAPDDPADPLGAGMVPLALLTALAPALPSLISIPGDPQLNSSAGYAQLQRSHVSASL